MAHLLLAATMAAALVAFAASAGTADAKPTATAGPAGVTDEQRTAIVSALARLAPKAPAPDDVRPSPIQGLLEVRSGSHIVYMTPDAQLLLEGTLVNTTTRTNLTQESVNRALAIDFSTLPLSDAMVTFKQGTGERHIAVFADPHCGFCKRYEPELAKLKDVTVHIFMVPVLGPRSQESVKRIACSADPATAWNDWMLRNVEPPAAPAQCAPAALATIERNQALARKLGINSTPTSLAAPRKRQAGLMQSNQLEAFVAPVRL